MYWTIKGIKVCKREMSLTKTEIKDLTYQIHVGEEIETLLSKGSFVSLVKLLKP